MSKAKIAAAVKQVNSIKQPKERPLFPSWKPEDVFEAKLWMRELVGLYCALSDLNLTMSGPDEPTSMLELDIETLSGDIKDYGDQVVEEYGLEPASWEPKCL